MTSSQLRVAVRTAPGPRARQVAEAGIKDVWEPLLQLLNGSPVAPAAGARRALSRPAR
ncbi:hypothetical protein [Actinoplanes xinjiangensis]|uniref:hypothetical protein n=1 Tax=Actinoplanes xinjiangensis TaxID=512350 RepID=UPI00341356F3